MVNSVSETAVLYKQVHVVRSSIGDHAIVSDNVDLLDSEVAPYAEIGRRNLVINSFVGEGSYTGSNDVLSHARIGRYCNISWNVGLGGGNHNYRAACMLTDHYWRKILDVDFECETAADASKGCEIGNATWIAQAVSVVSGVTIGDGAVIGAGSTVLSDIPPFAVAVGTPARVIKYRFDEETIKRLLGIAWWDWDREVIRANAGLLRANVDDEVLKKLERVSIER